MRNVGRPGRQVIGVIGGGMFAKNVFLPVVRQVARARGAELRWVATTRGVTARHLAKKYGFRYATADYHEVLQDKEVDRVFILTQHCTHAALVVGALRCGKKVFVEKPLCLSEEELRKISEVVRGNGGGLMVGFNRRYSPLTDRVREWFSGRASPLMMVYRVNAGYIPPDHWTQDRTVGGGRIIGEGCHFVDYLTCICCAVPMRVQVFPIRDGMGKYLPDDNVVMEVSFADGSVGTIVYSAQGSKAFSRERFEAFCGDAVAVVDDFRSLTLIRGARRKAVRCGVQEMGYREEVQLFLSKGTDPGISMREYEMVTRMTFEAQRQVDAVREAS